MAASSNAWRSPDNEIGWAEHAKNPWLARSRPLKCKTSGWCIDVPEEEGGCKAVNVLLGS